MGGGRGRKWSLPTSITVCGLMLASLSTLGPMAQRYLYTGARPSIAKPYDNVADFRPAYRNQHTHPTSIALHMYGTTAALVIAVMHPGMIPAAAIAVQIGLITFPIVRHLEDGLIEMAILVVTFVALTKLWSRRASPAIVVLCIAYGAAWIGHSFFELNRPTTFIYPTFSLICDLLAWAEWATGVVITL